MPAGQGGAMGYDAAGNLTTDTYTGTGTRTFDAENRMVSATANNYAVSRYVYDSAGKRARRFDGGTEVWHVYGLGGELLAEYGAGSVTPQKEYGYRSGELLITATNGGDVEWLTADQLGTPRMVVDQTGSLANTKRHDYLPFGEELSAGVGGRTTGQGYGQPNALRERWATYERDDETGLDFAQARYYSSAQGRFTSPDEFTGGPDELFDFVDDAADNPTFYADLTNPQSLNKYQYTYNNPLNMVDPDGHCPDCIWDAANVVMGAKSLYDNVKAGNVGSAVIDGIGIVADGAALAVPIVPGGAGTIIRMVRGADKIADAAKAANKADDVADTVGGLRRAGKKDAHHVIQDAAAKDVPGYKTNDAPGRQLPGPSNKAGTPHKRATDVQRQRGGGNYAAERRIGYKALRRAGASRGQARGAIKQADKYFGRLGVEPSTPMRIPKNRRKKNDE